MFAIRRGMVAAGDGPVLIDAAPAAARQMRALVVDNEVPALGIPERGDILMGYLPEQTVEVVDRARRRNFDRDVIAAQMVALAAGRGMIVGLLGFSLSHCLIDELLSAVIYKGQVY